MWVLYSLLSAFFAGCTAILAKCGIKNTDSDVATAIRTIVVLVFSFLMVFLAGSFSSIVNISTRTWTFLVLSGLCTGASWLFYFKALQKGNINIVVPIDKSSIVLTVLLAFFLLGENVDLCKLLGLFAIAAGTFLMIEKKEIEKSVEGWSWVLYAVLSAIFSSLTAVFGKIGIEDVESNLGTALRTVIVLAMAFLLVFIEGKGRQLKKIAGKELLFIILSGVATGSSWLCYYKALQEGKASIVVPMDKLSLLVTILFSFFVFKEKLSAKAVIGLVLIVSGTLLMLL